MAQLQARHPVNPGIASLPFGARLEQDVGPWPWHAVEDDQPQRLARHIDAVAHRVGSQQAGMRLLAEDLQQRLKVHLVDMLCIERQSLCL